MSRFFKLPEPPAGSRAAQIRAALRTPKRAKAGGAITSVDAPLATGSAQPPAPNGQPSGKWVPNQLAVLAPVPADIAKEGPENEAAYRAAREDATQRGIRLMNHLAAKGKTQSLAELISAGHSEAEVLAKLSSAKSDEERKAEAGWRRAAAVVNRQNGFEDDTPKRAIGSGWDKVVARHNAQHFAEVGQ